MYKVDFDLLTFTASGDVTAGVVVVANVGCEEGDYPETLVGQIALVMRGNCSFHEKVELAQAGNASAVLIYNDGADAGRMDAFSGTLGSPSLVPVLGLSNGVGKALVDIADTVVLNVYTSTSVVYLPTYNIIAETNEGDEDCIIVFGSHLDSVPAGPGINDNGSGSATNLEVLIQLYELGLLKRIENKIRFAWWGAEELGLLGSYHYVEQLLQKQEEYHRHCLNLNFDMIGSPKYAPMTAFSSPTTTTAGLEASTTPAARLTQTSLLALSTSRICLRIISETKNWTTSSSHSQVAVITVRSLQQTQTRTNLS